MYIPLESLLCCCWLQITKFAESRNSTSKFVIVRHNFHLRKLFRIPRNLLSISARAHYIAHTHDTHGRFSPNAQRTDLTNTNMRTANCMFAESMYTSESDASAHIHMLGESSFAKMLLLARYRRRLVSLSGWATVVRECGGRAPSASLYIPAGILFSLCLQLF